MSRSVRHRAARTLPSPTLAITLAFLAYAVVTFGLRLHVDDEGLLTYFFGAWTYEAPAATLFFQKSRPALSILYAAPSALGLNAFSAVHVLVAAAAIPLTAAVARRAGCELPWLAAAVVALSSLMLAGSVAGVSNTDAVTGAILAMWLLHVRSAPAAAGVVLGLLLFARSEMSLLAFVMIAVGGPERRHRWWLVAGLAATVIAYFASGALYHRDVVWMLHYPPALPSVNPALPSDALASRAGTPTELLVSLFSLSPAVVLLASARVRDATRIERTSAVFAILFVLVIRTMPLLGTFNFDASPRYLLPALPFVAIVAARVMERLAPKGRRRRSVSIAIVLLLIAATLTMRGTRMTTDPLVKEAADVITQAPEADVVTNMQTLGPLLELRGDDPARVRYLLQADQRYELERLTNARRGQRDAILDAMERRFYATPLVVTVLRPDDIASGTLFALRDDERLDVVMPPGEWRGWLRIVARGPGFRVATKTRSPHSSGQDAP